jgi:hypothetical protein
MDRKVGLAVAVGGVALIAVAALAWYSNQASKQEKFRAQVVPVVARISAQLKAAAALTGGGTAQTIERTNAQFTDLAGLGADLKALYVEGERQQALVDAGQAYRAATERFVKSQQDFARTRARLDAARAKVRESLDAKVRTSTFSMDFWKETNDRLTAELERVRKEANQARDRLVTVTAATQQAADAAGAVVGREAVVGTDVLAAHGKALDAIVLAKD